MDALLLIIAKPYKAQNEFFNVGNRNNEVTMLNWRIVCAAATRRLGVILRIASIQLKSSAAMSSTATVMRGL